MDKKLQFFSFGFPLPRGIHRLSDNLSWEYAGVYLLVTEAMYDNMSDTVELSVLKSAIDTEDRHIDSYVAKLCSFGVLSMDGTKVHSESVKSLLEKVRSTRSNTSDRVKRFRDNIASQENVSGNDYKSLVQQWNKQFPMTDIQLKTSYARFKSSNSWDHETVKNALEFIGNNPGIKNKIMCDWFEAGFFLPGYEFNVDTINEYFSKKGNNGKKIDTRDPTGLNTPYLEQGHKPEKFRSINLSEIKAQALSEQEIELARQLEKAI